MILYFIRKCADALQDSLDAGRFHSADQDTMQFLDQFNSGSSIQDMDWLQKQFQQASQLDYQTRLDDQRRQKAIQDSNNYGRTKKVTTSPYYDDDQRMAAMERSNVILTGRAHAPKPTPDIPNPTAPQRGTKDFGFAKVTQQPDGSAQYYKRAANGKLEEVAVDPKDQDAYWAAHAYETRQTQQPSQKFNERQWQQQQLRNTKQRPPAARNYNPRRVNYVRRGGTIKY